MNTSITNFVLKKLLKLFFVVLLADLIAVILAGILLYILFGTTSFDSPSVLALAYIIGGLLSIKYLIRTEKIDVRIFFDFSPMPKGWSLGNIAFIILCTFCLVMVIEPVEIWVPNYDTPLAGWVMLLIGCIVAPIVEEVLLRGIGMSIFLKRVSPAKAIIITSILFGLMHINPAQVVGATFSGLFLGWVYYKTRNLFFCILAHATNNMLAYLASILPMGKYDHMYQSFPNIYLYLLFYLCNVLALAVGLYYYNKFLNKKKERSTLDII